jgi:hypothetical protein
MEQQQIIKEMIKLNKLVMDNTFNSISTIQDLSTRMFTAFMDEATWLPAEGKKAITDWFSAYKKNAMTLKRQPMLNMKRLLIIS